MTVDTLLENQKITADTISVSLSKKELELLIDKMSDIPIINKQALNLYQKNNCKNLKKCLHFQNILLY